MPKMGIDNICGGVYKRYLTPLQPALPYRLKMRALLRAFTHFNQNLKITKKILRKKKRTRAYPSSKKDGYVYGDAFCVPVK